MLLSTSCPYPFSPTDCSVWNSVKLLTHERSVMSTATKTSARLASINARITQYAIMRQRVAQFDLHSVADGNVVNESIYPNICETLNINENHKVDLVANIYVATKVPFTQNMQRTVSFDVLLKCGDLCFFNSSPETKIERESILTRIHDTFNFVWWSSSKRWIISFQHESFRFK